MQLLPRRLWQAMDAHLGRCSKCMRQSFLAALGAAGLALALPLITAAPAVLLASTVAALGAAALWLAHLTAFALRSAAITREHQPKRRYALAFVRDLFVIAAATAVPFNAAFAQVPCRCPSNAPKCCYNYDGKNYVCAPSNAVCCAGNPPHYCQSGKQCYGTSGCR
jgi:hypothetical protein